MSGNSVMTSVTQPRLEESPLRERYLSILQDLCDLLDFEWAGTPRQSPAELSVAFDVDDARFALVHEQSRPGTLAVFCDFGELSHDVEPAVFRRLLEINLALAACEIGVLGADAETGPLVFHFRLRLHGLTAAALLPGLRSACIAGAGVAGGPVRRAGPSGRRALMGFPPRARLVLKGFSNRWPKPRPPHQRDQHGTRRNTAFGQRRLAKLAA